MADRDPNAIVSQIWLEKPDEFEGLQTPEGFVVGTGSGQYYASKITYADGRTEIQWYKRGSGPPGEKNDPVALTTSGPVAKSVKDKWDQQEQQQGNNPRQTPQPIAPGGQTTQQRKAADGQTHIYGYNPETGNYDLDQGAVASGTTRTPEQQTADQATANQATALDNERKYHQAMGHGYITHAEYQGQLDKRAAEIRAEEAAARADKNQERLTAAQEASNQLQRDRFQFDKDKENRPDIKSEGIDRNGQRYTVTTITPKDGTAPRQVILGPDGKQVDRIPQDAPTVSGPRMPQFVLYHSQEALGTIYNQLQDGVAKGLWSQKWADERWAQAYQMSQVAVQEAATQQREIESTRNAEINVAQGRATLGQNAIANAIGVVDKINGLLPAGSSGGGQMFAAILGLSMLSEARSGIDSVNVKGRQPLPQITPATLSNPQALAAAHAEITQQVQQAAAPAPESALQPTQAASPAPRPNAAPVASPGGGPAEPPARANIPPQPTSSMVPGTPSIVGDTGAPAVPMPSMALPSTPDADPLLNVRVNATGEMRQMRLSEINQNASAYTVMDPNTGAGQAGVPLSPAAPPDAAPSYGKPGASFVPSADPNDPINQHPGGSVLPQPDPMPSQYGGGIDTQSRMQPAQEYAVLAPWMQQPMSQPQQPQAPQQTDAPMPMALVHSRAAITPPWRMSEQEIEQYRAAGIPDDVIFGVHRPGMRVA